MVEWTFIILVVIAIFVAVELFKHHFMTKFSKLVIVFMLLVLILLISSSYLLSNNLIKTDNKIVVTSAAIFSDIKQSLDKHKLFNYDIANTTKFLDTRKIYK